MSLFSDILEKLGLKHPAEPAASAKPAIADSKPAPQVAPAPPPAAQVPPSAPAASQVKPATPPPAPAAPTAPPPAPATPVTAPPWQTVQEARPVSPAVPTPAAAPAPIPVVDVVSKLEHLAATNPQKLDWKVSIVDLLKLLGLDSSYAARKELAVELGCPTEMMADSAQMNTWLYKTVLQKIAENGGNIPKELLD